MTNEVEQLCVCVCVCVCVYVWDKGLVTKHVKSS